MRTPDLDKERSEKKISLAEFMRFYNDGLPSQFPRATAQLLRKYKKGNPGLFKDEGDWSLDVHRKKFMDWLPLHLKSQES